MILSNRWFTLVWAMLLLTAVVSFAGKDGHGMQAMDDAAAKLREHNISKEQAKPAPPPPAPPPVMTYEPEMAPEAEPEAGAPMVDNPIDTPDPDGPDRLNKAYGDALKTGDKGDHQDL